MSWSPLYNHSLHPISWAVATGATLIAAGTDIRQHRIPNALTAPVLAGGLLWAGVLAGWPGLADAAAGMLLLALPYVLLFVFAGGGAGDAKLMGALGAWLGVVSGLAALLGVALAGVALGVVAAVVRRRLRGSLRNVGFLVTHAAVLFWGRQFLGQAGDQPSAASAEPSGSAVQRRVPYGIAIFIGVCLAGIGVLTWRA